MGRGGGLAPVSSLCGARSVVHQELPRCAASVGAVRLLVDEVLAAHGVEDAVRETTVLLASELATDGVRHGEGDDLLLDVAVSGARVQLTVSADCARRPGATCPGVAEHSQQVLDIMAAAWEVRTGAGRRTGWCRLDRVPAPPALPAAPAVRPVQDAPAAQRRDRPALRLLR